jgi:hypothetical protein
MTASRRHGWTKGATKILLGARKYKVTYRARKRLPEGGFGEWQTSSIWMTVEPSAEDPEGQKALQRRIRFARERANIEMEVHEIEDCGDEVPLQTTKDSISRVVSEEDYEGLKRKAALTYPGHPSWEKSKLVN